MLFNTFSIVLLLLFAGLFSCSSDSAEKGTPKAESTNVDFTDNFDGKLADGWSWLREDTSTWQIKNNGLEIMVESGKAKTVKNALVRKAPDRRTGTFSIDVTVTSHTAPTQQYEQAGITWYNNEKPVFKLVKELVDGELYIIPGKVPMTAKTVQLRLVVQDTSWTAKFRPNAEGEFQTAAQGTLPQVNNDQVSIQCYNGPPDAEHWIRFENFAITKLK
jgi:hypothetical protein